MAVSLSSLLADKLKADGLSLAAAATKSGISLPSLRGVLKGSSKPNKRSTGKYAAFLGLSAEQLAEISSPAKSAIKVKGKPGRKPGSKNKPGPKPKGKPGRKPGSKNKPKIGAVAAGGPLAAVAQMLQAAEAVLADDLAVKVSKLSKKARATLSAIIGSL